MPPVVAHADGPPDLLDLPTGTPLGVGAGSFSRTAFDLGPGDRLVLYTDGLVEIRDQPIDKRLDRLQRLLAQPDPTVEDTCDRLLHELRHPGDHDDVAWLAGWLCGLTPLWCRPSSGSGNQRDSVVVGPGDPKLDLGLPGERQAS
jgi:hypothetical protein